MSDYELINCSPIAEKRIIDKNSPIESKRKDLRAKYPLSELEPGLCFTIPIAELKSLPDFRTLVSKYSKKTGMKFTVITHKENGLYEIARIY